MKDIILEYLEKKKTPYWLKIRGIIANSNDTMESSNKVLGILRENGLKLNKDLPNIYHSETMKFIDKIFKKRKEKNNSKKCLILSSDSEDESDSENESDSEDESDSENESDSETEKDYNEYAEYPNYTISQINSNIKSLIEHKYQDVITFEAEISNMSVHKNNTYLNFKDKQSKIKGVIWRKKYQGMENGKKVKVIGKLTSYIPNGEYQIVVHDLSPIGSGDLMKKQEMTKKKLEKLGYFDKKKLPIKTYNQSIAIISSKDAAGFGDMIHRIRSKNQWMKIRLFTSSLQGKSCSKEIVENIRKINKLDNIDLILIGRGGGSRDDLIEYDNEKLVETIFHSKIPIITAIGHQKDKSLADLVADKSFITPTEASDKITINTTELKNYLSKLKLVLIDRVKNKILSDKKTNLRILNIYNRNLFNSVVFYKDNLKKSIQKKINHYQYNLVQTKLIFNPSKLLKDLMLYKTKLIKLMLDKISNYQSLLISYEKKYNKGKPNMNNILLTSDTDLLNSEEKLMDNLKNEKYLFVQINSNKRIKILIKDFILENIS